MLTFASLRQRPFRSAAAASFVVFLGLQLVRPALPNPSVTADLDAPAEVKSIRRASWYDCHSNETKLPWYDQVVPGYWSVVNAPARVGSTSTPRTSARAPPPSRGPPCTSP